MSEVTTIGLDIAKHVFHAHGADERGVMVFSRKLTRGKLLDFFAKHPRCVVALEGTVKQNAPAGNRVRVG